MALLICPCVYNVTWLYMYFVIILVLFVISRTIQRVKYLEQVSLMFSCSYIMWNPIITMLFTIIAHVSTHLYHLLKFLKMGQNKMAFQMRYVHTNIVYLKRNRKISLSGHLGNFWRLIFRSWTPNFGVKHDTQVKNTAKYAKYSWRERGYFIRDIISPSCGNKTQW